MKRRKLDRIDEDAKAYMRRAKKVQKDKVRAHTVLPGSFNLDKKDTMLQVNFEMACRKNQK